MWLWWYCPPLTYLKCNIIIWLFIYHWGFRLSAGWMLSPFFPAGALDHRVFLSFSVKIAVTHPTKSELVFARKKILWRAKICVKSTYNLAYARARAFFAQFSFAQNCRKVSALQHFCNDITPIITNKGKNCQNLRKISTFWRFYVNFAPLISFLLHKIRSMTQIFSA